MIWIDDIVFFFFFSSRRRHTRSKRDWSSDVCSSDLIRQEIPCRADSRADFAVVRVIRVFGVLIHVADAREANLWIISNALKRRLLNILQILFGIEDVIVLVYHDGLGATGSFVRGQLNGVANAVVQSELRLHAPTVSPIEAVTGQDTAGQQWWRGNTSCCGSDTRDRAGRLRVQGQASRERAKTAAEQPLGRIHHAQHHRIEVSVFIRTNASRNITLHVDTQGGEGNSVSFADQVLLVGVDALTVVVALVSIDITQVRAAHLKDVRAFDPAHIVPYLEVVSIPVAGPDVLVVRVVGYKHGAAAGTAV